MLLWKVSVVSFPPKRLLIYFQNKSVILRRLVKENGKEVLRLKLNLIYISFPIITSRSSLDIIKTFPHESYGTIVLFQMNKVHETLGQAMLRIYCNLLG